MGQKYLKKVECRRTRGLGDLYTYSTPILQYSGHGRGRGQSKGGGRETHASTQYRRRGEQEGGDIGSLSLSLSLEESTVTDSF